MVARLTDRRAGPALSSALALTLTLIFLSLPSVTAQSGTPAATPISDTPNAELPPAWLEFGPDGHLMVRVIVAGQCPLLVLDGLAAPMSARGAADDDFPFIGCEATVPFGASVASIADQQLPLPTGPFTRIAVIGDTGCRLNDWEKKFQDCNDPAAWPFAEVAASVAVWNPDLIVHVGDYLYRESLCPEGMAGCTGSPHGDNWPTWDADFFAPAQSLLGIAPWVFMRGNHETCDRNPEGWFRYLDPRSYQAQCQQFTEPYVTVLHGLTLAVIDSAEAADTTVKPDEEAEYARQFAELAAVAPPESWLVTHRPVWGILAGKQGEFEVENASYEAATGGSLEADYAVVVSGHIHVAESIAFAASSGRPPQIISGNAGTALDDVPTASPTAGQLGDPAVTDADTLYAFGFLTLESDGENWIATQRDTRGQPLLDCVLELPEVTCEAAAPTG